MSWILPALAAALVAAVLLGLWIARGGTAEPDAEPEQPSSRLPLEIRHLEKAVETMQLGVTVTDLEGTILYVNPADAAMHGYSREELVGRDVRLFAPPPLADPMAPEEVAEMERWSRESVNVRSDGTEFPVQLMSDVVRDADGDPVAIITTCEDITRRKQAERALEESEERYALALRGADEGLWDWNLETDEVFYSSRWKSMLGYGDPEIGSSPDEWMSRVHPDDLARLKADLRAHREGDAPRFECEHRVLASDRSYRWVLARGIAERGPDGRPYRVTGSLRDITEQKSQEERLAREALYDSLTGLPNRSFLTDLLDRTFHRLERNPDYRFGLLFLDLDDFKEVNDALGHAAGDELLAEVARRLQGILRPGDVVARMSGDEFCILLDDLRDSPDTTRVAERIQEVLNVPVLLDGREVRTSASIGIAVSDDKVKAPDEMLRFADMAMYRAKAQGPGRFEIYDRGMHARAVALLEMEADLRAAVDAGQLRLVYQPVVDLESRRVTDLEALLRWNHPEHGEVHPSSFVPLAEQTGVIVEIGWWVLEEASRRMSGWIRRFPSLSDLTVSVNLSARQFRQPDLVPRVGEILEDARLDPMNLRLEIGEGALMERAEASTAIIRRFRDLGVQVQIDDFGTGTSSLAYLKRFDISALKIDGSFIRRMDDPGEKSALVQAVITLARDLEIPVVAEGVETPEQSRRLQSLLCEQGQGFLYSRPLDPEGIGAMLEEEAERRDGRKQ